MTAPLESEALVLRTRDFGEADRIVTLLTPTLGKLSAFARGSRKSTRSFRGGLGVFATLSAKLIRAVATASSRASSRPRPWTRTPPSPPTSARSPAPATPPSSSTSACKTVRAPTFTPPLRASSRGRLARRAGVGRRGRSAPPRAAAARRARPAARPRNVRASTHAPLGGAARWIDGVGLVDADTRAARDGVLLSGAAIGWLRGVAAGRFPRRRRLRDPSSRAGRPSGGSGRPRCHGRRAASRSCATPCRPDASSAAVRRREPRETRAAHSSSARPIAK
ncbi:MAG: recombination protein O N-terminal domain-containing protein [Myxococcales bacterium]|nr:recombination protein O N-terminal domain-containing protein [Myxococcales bacterium]